MTHSKTAVMPHKGKISYWVKHHFLWLILNDSFAYSQILVLEQKYQPNHRRSFFLNQTLLGKASASVFQFIS